MRYKAENINVVKGEKTDNNTKTDFEKIKEMTVSEMAFFLMNIGEKKSENMRTIE